MLVLTALIALLGGLGTVALVVRRHTRDDFGPSLRDYAAFRAALAAIGSPRDRVRV